MNDKKEGSSPFLMWCLVAIIFVFISIVMVSKVMPILKRDANQKRIDDVKRALEEQTREVESPEK